MLLFRKVAKVVKAGEAGKVGKGVRARDGRAGQAALEFLLNYGWAILGVLVVLGGLARFGVLSPANLVPEKCSFPGSVGCPDFEVGSNGIRLILQNRAGKDIVVSGIGFGSDALSQQSSGCSTGAMSAVVKNGEKATFYANDPFNCAFKDTGRPKNRYNVTVAYSFLGSQGISHSLSGELLARKGESAVSGGAGEYGGGGSYDSSLIGYWRFEEGSGTSASDSSTNGNAGTLAGFGCTTLDCDPNSGWTSAGKMGRALVFDTDEVLIPGADFEFGTSTDFTLEAWVKTTYQGNRNVIVRSGLGKLFYMQTNYGVGQTNRIQCSIRDGINTVALNSDLPPEITAPWNHIACVFDRDGLVTPYVNGEAATGASIAPVGDINMLAAWLFIGTGGAWFDGTIDEVRVWNRALSAQEIAALAAQ